jgi:hypothetical protein
LNENERNVREYLYRRREYRFLYDKFVKPWEARMKTLAEFEKENLFQRKVISLFESRHSILAEVRQITTLEARLD